MEKEKFPPADRDDLDGPPEQDLAALFAAARPPERAVDVERLLAVAAMEKSPRRPLPLLPGRNPMSRRIVALVSTAAAVAAAVALFVLFGSNPQISLAEVINQVAKTRSVTMKQSVAVIGKPNMIVRASFLASGLGRIDMPDGNYTVADTKGNMLCVWPSKKSATVMHALNVPSVNVYEKLRSIAGGRSKRLADEVVSGKTVNVFQVKWDDQAGNRGGCPIPSMKVWVDGQTHLPIRLEDIPRGDDKPTWSCYDIVFDQPLDPSLFSLTPPEGFTVTTQGLASLPAPPSKRELLAPEVIPGVGFGPLKFGMSRAEVVQILGKPDLEGKTNLEYPSRGYGLIVSDPRGLVLVNCSSQAASAFQTRDFAGKTKEGVGIGSSLADLEKAFGKPDSVRTNGPATSYVEYHKLGLEFTLFSGKVVTFTLKPTSR